MTNYVLVITEPIEHIDRGLQTASWWDRYELLPGEYPVVWKTVHNVATHHDSAYYGTITVDAILRESYRVNQLFSASSSETTLPDTRKTVTFTLYKYLFDSTGTNLLSLYGQMKLV